MKLSNKAYDVLKYISRYVLPAIGALYFTIAKIWGLPLGAEICATCSAVCVAINTALGISSEQYYKDKDNEKETGDES